MALRRYLSRSRARILAIRLSSYMVGSRRYIAASESVKRCVDALHQEAASNVSLEDAVEILRAESNRSASQILRIVQREGATIDAWGMYVAEAEHVYDRFLPRLICCYRGREADFVHGVGWRCPS